MSNQTTFEIDAIKTINFPNGEKDKFKGGLNIVETDENVSKMIKPDEVVCVDKEITIVFDYPLARAFEFEFKNDKGFTRKDFYTAIRSTYERIYDVEDTSCGPTENTPGLLNRGFSDGPYGIWGHSISDLCIERVNRSESGKYELFIGS